MAVDFFGQGVRTVQEVLTVIIVNFISTLFSYFPVHIFQLDPRNRSCQNT